MCASRASIEEAEAVVEAAKRNLGSFYVTASITKAVRHAFEDDFDFDGLEETITRSFDFGPFQTIEESAKAAAFLESDGCEEVTIVKR